MKRLLIHCDSCTFPDNVWKSWLMDHNFAHTLRASNYAKYLKHLKISDWIHLTLDMRRLGRDLGQTIVSIGMTRQANIFWLWLLWSPSSRGLQLTLSQDLEDPNIQVVAGIQTQTSKGIQRAYSSQRTSGRFLAMMELKLLVWCYGSATSQDSLMKATWTWILTTNLRSLRSLRVSQYLRSPTISQHEQ